MRTVDRLPFIKRRMSDATNMPFKICSMCLKAWDDCESFMSDPELVLNGYQAFFDKPEDGLILFTHRAKGCRSTLALKASAFKDLYHGPNYDILNRGTSSCPRLCLESENFELCEEKCSMHWVRIVLNLLRNRHLS